ncbi:MAG: RnfABCDGE type electron transport complex subunit G [Chitinivibrionales bacterium]|nr:RnfABCDGE type electron transport complex subunit G [Chitinivibrionales bacterium]
MLDIIKLSVVLTLVAVGSGLVVALTYSNTKEEIQAQQQRNQLEALQAVFPEGINIEEKEGSKPLPEQYWVAKANDSIVGYAFKESSKGYAGDIQIMVGVDLQGTILGLKVLSHKETPGLGDRVKETPSKKYLWTAFSGQSEKSNPWFTEQFESLNVYKEIGISKSAEYHTLPEKKKEALEEANNVTAITGATISTRAVVTGVTREIPSYLNHLKSNGKAQ